MPQTAAGPKTQQPSTTYVSDWLFLNLPWKGPVYVVPKQALPRRVKGELTADVSGMFAAGLPCQG